MGRYFDLNTEMIRLIDESNYSKLSPLFLIIVHPKHGKLSRTSRDGVTELEPIVSFTYDDVLNERVRYTTYITVKNYNY